MLVFRQLFDPASSTYTYLLADGRSSAAVIIDPVFEQVRRDAALIEELDLRLLYSLETHVHADHVTAAWMLKQRTGCRIAVSAASGAEGADRYLVPDDTVGFGERNLQVRATPGHTNGCLTYVLDDRSVAFTGDCLMIRGSGRTDFQQGDPGAMFRSVREQIFSLPDSCLLYPAHDYRGLTVTSVGEECRFNPRLGGQRRRGCGPLFSARRHRRFRRAQPAGPGNTRPHQRLPDLCARRSQHGLHRRLPDDPGQRADRLSAG